MNNNNKTCHTNLHRGLLATAITVGLGLSPVHAFQFDTGSEDWAVRFDNTLKLNYAQRVESANSKLANSFNNNDGNRNFSAGSADATDPVCELSPAHADVAVLRDRDAAALGTEWTYRGA